MQAKGGEAGDVDVATEASPVEEKDEAMGGGKDAATTQGQGEGESQNEKEIQTEKSAFR